MVRAGQRLKSQRVKSGLTLEQVAHATKIKEQYLFAIENADYSKLPSTTYAYGFVRNYTRFLGLSEKEVLALFRREYGEEKVVKVLPDGLPKDEFPIHKIKFSQAVKIAAFILAPLLAYIVFQYRFAIINPPLKVFLPKEGEIFLSQLVNIVGKTDPNASVFVNKDPVSVDSKGNFKKTVNVFLGKTTIIIRVVNYFGRETKVERHIEVKDKKR